MTLTTGEAFTSAEESAFRWNITAPSGSEVTAVTAGTAAAEGATTATGTFTPDKAGTYSVTATWGDGATKTISKDVIIYENKLESTGTKYTGNVITLTLTVGEAFTETEADAFVWSITAPGESGVTAVTEETAAAKGTTTATGTFIPDKAGTYRVTATWGDGATKTISEVVGIEQGPTLDITKSLLDINETSTLTLKGEDLEFDTATSDTENINPGDPATGKVDGAIVSKTIEWSVATVDGDESLTTLTKGNGTTFSAAKPGTYEVTATYQVANIEEIDGKLYYGDPAFIEGEITESIKVLAVSDNIKFAESTVIQTAPNVYSVTLEVGNSTERTKTLGLIDAIVDTEMIGTVDWTVTGNGSGAEYVQVTNEDDGRLIVNAKKANTETTPVVATAKYKDGNNVLTSTVNIFVSQNSVGLSVYEMGEENLSKITSLTLDKDSNTVVWVEAKPGSAGYDDFYLSASSNYENMATVYRPALDDEDYEEFAEEYDYDNTGATEVPPIGDAGKYYSAFIIHALDEGQPTITFTARDDTVETIVGTTTLALTVTDEKLVLDTEKLFLAMNGDSATIKVTSTNTSKINWYISDQYGTLVEEENEIIEITPSSDNRSVKVETLYDPGVQYVAATLGNSENKIVLVPVTVLSVIDENNKISAKLDSSYDPIAGAYESKDLGFVAGTGDTPLRADTLELSVYDGTNKYTDLVTWTMTPAGVVTIDKGKVTAVKAGTVKITGEYKGVKQTIDVKVVDKTFTIAAIGTVSITNDTAGETAGYPVSPSVVMNKTTVNVADAIEAVENEDEDNPATDAQKLATDIKFRYSWSGGSDPQNAAVHVAYDLNTVVGTITVDQADVMLDGDGDGEGSYLVKVEGYYGTYAADKVIAQSTFYLRVLDSTTTFTLKPLTGTVHYMAVTDQKWSATITGNQGLSLDAAYVDVPNGDEIIWEDDYEENPVSLNGTTLTAKFDAPGIKYIDVYNKGTGTVLASYALVVFGFGEANPNPNPVLSENGDAYSKDIYITSNTTKYPLTREYTIVPTADDIKNIAGNTNVSLKSTWSEDSEEKVAKLTTATTDPDYVAARTVTAVEEGSANVAISILVNGTSVTPATGTSTVRLVAKTNVYNYKEVKVADISDIVLLAGGTSEKVSPTIAGSYPKASFKYQISNDPTANTIRLKAFDVDGLAKTASTKDDPVYGAFVELLQKNGASADEIKISAIVKGGADDGSDIELATKTVKVTTVIAPSKVIRAAGTTIEAGDELKGNLAVVTNLIAGDKNGTIKKNATLADLTNSDYGIYTFGSTSENGVTSSYDWKDPTIRLSDYTGRNTVTTTAVLTVKSGDTVITTKEEAITLVLTSVKGLEVKVVDNNNVTYGPAGSVSLNMAESVALTTPVEANLVYSDGTNADSRTNAYLGLFAAKFGVIDYSKAVTSSKTDIAEVKDAKTDDDNKVKGTFKLSTTAKAGSAKITVSALGFTATIDVKSVDKLAAFNKAELGGDAKAAGSVYYVDIQKKSVTSVPLSIEMTGKATAITLKTSDKSVAAPAVTKVTLDSSLKASTTVNIGKTGHAVLTLTADDTPKTSKTIDVYVVSAEEGATISNMLLYKSWNYAADSDENLLDIVVKGTGYDIINQVDISGTDASNFKVVKTAGVDAIDNEYRITFDDTKVKAGTYTVDFTIQVASSIDKDNLIQTVDVKGVEIKVEVPDTNFKASDFKAKQDGTYNVFYKDNFAEIQFTGTNAAVGAVKLDTTSYYQIVWPVTDAQGWATLDADGVVIIRLTNGNKDITMETLKTATKGDARKLTFEVKPEGYTGDTAYTLKPLTLKTANKIDTSLEKFKLAKSSGTIYTNTALKLEKIVSVKLTNAGTGKGGSTYGVRYVDAKSVKTVVPNYRYTDSAVAESGNGTVVLEALNGAADAKGKIELTNDEWLAKDQTVLLNYNVKLNSKASKVGLVLDKNTITLNTGNAYIGEEKAYVNVSLNGGVSLTGKQTVKVVPANSKSTIGKDGATSGVNYTYDEGTPGVVTFYLNGPVGTGTYKYNIVTTVGSEVKKSITLKVVNVAANNAVKLSKKGSIDILDRNAVLTVTPKLTGFSGNIVGAALDGTHKDYFDRSVVAGTNGVVQIKAKALGDEGRPNYATNQTYSLNIKYHLDINGDGAGDIYVTSAKPITFKVKQGKVSAVVSPTQPLISTGGTRKVTLSAWHKLSSGTKAVTLADVAEAASNDYASVAYITQVNNTDKVKVNVNYNDSRKLDDGHWVGRAKVTALNIKPGKTVSVKIQVHQVGEATNLKPATVTLKVKAPK